MGTYAQKIVRARNHKLRFSTSFNPMKGGPKGKGFESWSSRSRNADCGVQRAQYAHGEVSNSKGEAVEEHDPTSAGRLIEVQKGGLPE